MRSTDKININNIIAAAFGSLSVPWRRFRKAFPLASYISARFITMLVLLFFARSFYVRSYGARSRRYRRPDDDAADHVECAKRSFIFRLKSR